MTNVPPVTKLLGWRAVARLAWRISKAPTARCPVLITGAGKVGQQVAGMVREYAWTGLQLVGYLDDDLNKQECGLPVLGTLDDVAWVVREYGVEDVVIALPRRAHKRLNELVATLHELPVRIRVVPDYFALALYRAAAEEFAGIPMINLRAPALKDYQRLVKRLLVVGGILTPLALPVMGVVALAVKLDSPGPVLFRQPRVGENGRLFTMYKFRSMVANAEALQEQVNEVHSDGRIIHKKSDAPPGGAGGAVDPAVQPERTAAVDQRVDRRHESGRAAAGASGLRQPVPSLHSTLHEPPLGEGRHDRLGAGQRPARRYLHSRQDALRPVVHRELVAVVGHQDSHPHILQPVQVAECVLKSLSVEILVSAPNRWDALLIKPAYAGVLCFHTAARRTPGGWHEPIDTDDSPDRRS